VFVAFEINCILHEEARISNEKRKKVNKKMLIGLAPVHFLEKDFLCGGDNDFAFFSPLSGRDQLYAW
jgi:hypothetical protein